MENNKNNQNNNHESNDTTYLPIGMCLGISLGVAIGSALGNVGVGICIGLSIGVGLGALLDARHRKEAAAAAADSGEMTQEKYEALATAKVKEVIDLIAAKNYSGLCSAAQIDPSWCGGKSQEEGMAAFGEWLNGQLEMWAEDAEKQFVVAPFDADRLELSPLENGRSAATYSPTSFGEKLDLWFEFDFSVSESGELTTVFNVNI